MKKCKFCNNLLEEHGAMLCGDLVLIDYKCFSCLGKNIDITYCYEDSNGIISLCSIVFCSKFFPEVELIIYEDKFLNPILYYGGENVINLPFNCSEINPLNFDKKLKNIITFS